MDITSWITSDLLQVVEVPPEDIGSGLLKYFS